MKKTITILGVFMLLASGCNQATTNQAIINTESTLTITENVDSVEVQDVSENEPFDSLLTPRCFLYLDGLHESEIQLFSIERIDSITFFTTKNNTDIQRMEIEKITDLEQIKEVLGDRVIWGTREGFVTEFVVCRGEGDVFYGNARLWVVAYFPQFDVLLGEAEDVAVFRGFDLTTGAVVGSPVGDIFSPSKRFRLSSFDTGQNFNIYFIQEKIDGQYQTTIDLFCEFQRRLSKRLGWIISAFWKNDMTLYAITSPYITIDGEQKLSYYRIILK